MKELLALWEKEKIVKSQERLFISNEKAFIKRLKAKVSLNAKYRDITMKGSNGGLCGYFKELIKYKKKSKDDSISNYLYISEIPF
jgi:hypothetical protein